MSKRAWVMAALVGLTAAPLRAADPLWVLPVPLPDARNSEEIHGDALQRPLSLDDAAIYPQLGPREDDQVNNGGVHFDFDLRYFNRYLYRGVDQSTTRHPENALQFDGRAEFDLGKLPHPFVGLFVNVFNHDPISRFEEVRPYGGLEWTLKPFIFAGGLNAYIYPNRKPLDTQDVWASATFEDSRLFHTQRPLLSPYIYAAYDVQLYHGFYFETGVKHDFVLEDLGATFTAFADMAYVLKQPYFALPGRRAESGFQHYDLGLIGSYSLNNLFSFSRRHGEWSIVGYFYYTDGLANHVRADTRLWGGVGLRFNY